ncbi:MAG: hypothetical protein IKJ65_12495 [Clostridia bacterium]|nr:hypothetical protein [Clostridia bacterium]
MPENFEHICVFDTGGTSARSIVKKLRALGVSSVLIGADKIGKHENTKGVIYAGNGIVLKATDGAQEAILSSPVPVLALGANAEIALKAAGGETEGIEFEKKASHVEFRESRLFSTLTEGDRYFERLPCVRLPENAIEIARADGQAAAFHVPEKNLFGAFFTMESNDPDGLKMLENFARDICKIASDWNMESYLEFAVSKMQAAFPSSSVAVACSGGLLSTVAFLIANRALGKRARCVIVDTGLLPKGEIQNAEKAIFEACGREITRLDAKEDTLLRLRGVMNGREKREIVYKIIHEKIKELAPSSILASFIGNFSPTDGLFRDEVRTLGRILGLKEEFLFKRPFPGGGLAVRISGEATEDKIKVIKNADGVFESEIRSSGLDRKLWQYYASLIGTEAGEFVILHALLSGSHASGYAYRLPYDVIEKTVMRVMEICPDAEGVLYDVSGRWAPLFSL